MGANFGGSKSGYQSQEQPVLSPDWENLSVLGKNATPQNHNKRNNNPTSKILIERESNFKGKLMDCLPTREK